MCLHFELWNLFHVVLALEQHFTYFDAPGAALWPWRGVLDGLTRWSDGIKLAQDWHSGCFEDSSSQNQICGRPDRPKENLWRQVILGNGGAWQWSWHNIWFIIPCFADANTERSRPNAAHALVSCYKSEQFVRICQCRLDRAWDFVNSWKTTKFWGDVTSAIVTVIFIMSLKVEYPF